MTTRVRSVTAAAAAAGSRPAVARSTSANTGTAPAADHRRRGGHGRHRGTITSSPRSIPIATSASRSASVPDATATADGARRSGELGFERLGLGTEQTPHSRARR